MLGTIVIEQTNDYKNRVQYDPVTNTFSETPYLCLFAERDFPHPYGWLKGFGTPPERHLDCFLLSRPGCRLGDEYPVRVVGVFVRNDGDHKLVSINPDRPEARLDQLPEGERQDLYRLYPLVREGEGWFGPEKAKEIIRHF